MIRLTYISSVVRGAETDATLSILEDSRRNNARCGVTGLLLSDGRRFLQALEGEEAAVAATFERIRADPRHRACVMLDRREIATRAFPGWHMAWQPIGAAATGGAGLADTVDAMTAQIEDRSLRALFTGFARIDRSAA